MLLALKRTHGDRRHHKKNAYPPVVLALVGGGGGHFEPHLQFTGLVDCDVCMYVYVCQPSAPLPINRWGSLPQISSYAL